VAVKQCSELGNRVGTCGVGRDAQYSVGRSKESTGASKHGDVERGDLRVEM
jgi:hypothetical protein